MPYQVHPHEDYLEVRLSGVLESEVSLTNLADQAGSAGARILVDYSAVTDVVVDTYLLGQEAKRCEELGLKVAVYAPRPALFGINRQALQLGLVREGVSFSVFNDLEAAREWLRAS